MKTTVDGLVIWEKKTGEADRVISILTPRGVITAYAKGALRPKNKLSTATAMLSYSNFELFSGKNMYSIDDATVNNRFIKLETDITGYALATYFCELLKELAPADETAAEMLILMLNTLYVLNENNKDLNVIKAAFELKIMSLAGYSPDLFGCSCCGVEDSNTLYFNIQEGHWICENCAPGQHVIPNCSLTFLRAMRHVVLGESKRMYSFSLPPAVAKQFSDFTSAYLMSHVDRRFNTLDFFMTLNQ